MAKPTREEYRKLTRQELLGRFEEECLRPSRERVRANPEKWLNETWIIRKEAKEYFRSRYGDLPKYQEALYIFAKARLDDLVRDEAIAQKVLRPWDEENSHYDSEALILYPEHSWDRPSYGNPRETTREPGLVEYVRDRARYSTTRREPPNPPPPPPRDTLELRLEANVLRAEEELARQKETLRAYREAKEKAAQEQVERDRATMEKAEREAREKQAREQAEQEARERAERQRRSREQSAHRTQSLPQWAVVLELTPPYSEDQMGVTRRPLSRVCCHITTSGAEG
jgi:hypothetical protein